MFYLQKKCLDISKLVAMGMRIVSPLSLLVLRDSSQYVKYR